jgi:hypothetical protein
VCHDRTGHPGSGGSLPVSARGGDCGTGGGERAWAGGLAGGASWCVQPGELPTGFLALNPVPLLPGRSGRCAPVLRSWDVLCLALYSWQPSVHYVSHSYLCELLVAVVRLVVHLLLARTAEGTVSESLSQGRGGFSHALGNLVSALLSCRLLR